MKKGHHVRLSHIPRWKLWIVGILGLSKQVYRGPVTIEYALRDKLQIGIGIGVFRGQQSHPVCFSCPLYQQAQKGSSIPYQETTPAVLAQQETLYKLIDTGTLPKVTGEMTRRFTRKLHQGGLL